MPRFVVSLLSGLLLTGAAVTAAAQDDLARAANPEGRAFLPVEEFGTGISQWQADGRDALYLQGAKGNWYHAQLLRPCLNLPYATIISFVTDGGPSLDEFSSVLVRGQRCWFKSVEPSDGPPSDKEE